MTQLDTLLEYLRLEKVDNCKYVGKNLDIGSPQIYGGHVVSQATMAAFDTITSTKNLHSLHSYFLHPGDNALDINYEVEIIKNGRSFDVRRILASQKGRTIFIMAASFHIYEDSIEHQVSMPNVIRPDKLTSTPEIFAEFSQKFNIKPRGIFAVDSPIIFHPVFSYNPIDPGQRPARNSTWFKANGDVSDDKNIQTAIIAYASDFNLLITSLLPHGISLFKDPYKIASLDHSMWFHRPVSCNDWLLYDVTSPNLSSGRAYCKGQIFSSKGDLLVSVTQEGLIRKIKK